MNRQSQRTQRITYFEFSICCINLLCGEKYPNIINKDTKKELEIYNYTHYLWGEIKYVSQNKKILRCTPEIKGKHKKKSSF